MAVTYLQKISFDVLIRKKVAKFYFMVRILSTNIYIYV